MAVHQHGKRLDGRQQRAVLIGGGGARAFRRRQLGEETPRQLAAGVLTALQRLPAPGPPRQMR